MYTINIIIPFLVLFHLSFALGPNDQHSSAHAEHEQPHHERSMQPADYTIKGNTTLVHHHNAVVKSPMRSSVTFTPESRPINLGDDVISWDSSDDVAYGSKTVEIHHTPEQTHLEKRSPAPRHQTEHPKKGKDPQHHKKGKEPQHHKKDEGPQHHKKGKEPHHHKKGKPKHHKKGKEPQHSKNGKHPHKAHDTTLTVTKSSCLTQTTGQKTKVVTVVETFRPMIYSKYASIEKKKTIPTKVVIHGKTTTVPVVVYPGGLGYSVPTHLPSGEPLLSLPSGRPKIIKHKSKHGKHTSKHTGTVVPPHVTSKMLWPPKATSSVGVVSTETEDGASTTTDDNGHTTVFPIIGPLHCFFCPVIGGTKYGFVLPPLPQGVYPQLEIPHPTGGPPGIHFPPITIPKLTILPGGTPVYASEKPSETGTKKSCKETSTVTDKTIYVSYLKNKASKTTATRTFSTAFEERTGCSLHRASTETRTTVAKCEETQTVTDKTVYVSYGLNSRSKTTAISTITTKLEKVSGCDPTPTTVTTTTKARCSRPTSEAHGNHVAVRANEDEDCPRSHYVFPVNGKDISAANSIGEALRQAVGKDESIKVFGNTNSPSGIDYWILDVTRQQAKELEEKHSKLIRSVVPPPKPCIRNSPGCPRLSDNYGDPDSQHENSRRVTSPGAAGSGYHNSTLIGRAPEVVPLPESWPPQDEAPLQLVAITKPPRNPEKEMELEDFYKEVGRKYYYDESGGEGIEVYVFDTGADKKLEEFAHVKKWRWMGPKWPEPKNYKDMLPGNWEWEDVKAHKDFSNDKHGSGILSGILGRKYGVAKNVKPIIIADGINRNGKLDLNEILTNYVAMLDYVMYDRQKKYGEEAKKGAPLAILNWSLGLDFGTEDFHAEKEDGTLVYGPWELNMLDLLRDKIIDLGSMGVLTVAAAGNVHKVKGVERGTGIQEWPALAGTDLDWSTEQEGSKTRVTWQMLIVGSVDPEGRNLGPLESEFISVYAPGRKTTNAAVFEEDIINLGTSFATAMTSGLAAYYAGLKSFQEEKAVKGKSARVRVKALGNKIIKTSYSRLRPGQTAPKKASTWPKVIYNGYSGDEHCKASGSNSKRRGNALRERHAGCGSLKSKTQHHSHPHTVTKPPATPSCTFVGPNPPVVSAYCKCSGSTFRPRTSRESGTINSCALTKLPTVTYDPIPTGAYTTISSLCLKGSAYAGNGVDWTSIKDCTVSPTPTKTPEPAPTCHLRLHEKIVPIGLPLGYPALTVSYQTWGTLSDANGKVLVDRSESDALVLGDTPGSFGDGPGLKIFLSGNHPTLFDPSAIQAILGFEYGAQKWTTEDVNSQQLPYCFPSIFGVVVANGERSMDCYFRC